MAKLQTLPRYFSQDLRQNVLQLHDHHTVWKLDNDKKTDEDFYSLVESAKIQFEMETGVDLLFEGRSGRHICVDDTPENSRHFQYLQNKALKLEKWVINEFNKKD